MWVKLRRDGSLTPYLDVGRRVRRAGVVHADETRHFRGAHMYWLWALATAQAVYFMTHASRGMAAADQLLADVAGVVVTDDYADYNHLPPHRRQLCWAHRVPQQCGSDRQGAVREVREATSAMEESWPFGVCLQGLASNRPERHWLKSVVVVSVGGKAQVHVAGQVRIEKASMSEPPCRRRNSR